MSTADNPPSRPDTTPPPLSAEGATPVAVDPDQLVASPDTQESSDTDRDIATGSGCLVALGFREPLMAQEALLAAIRLRSKGHLGMQDAAIVVKDAGDRVSIQQTRDLDAVQGASGGLWLGVLAGLFVPGGILIGGALGAAVGGLWAKLRDIGISDKRMKELAESLPVGHAALFMLVDDAHRFHAMAELRRFPATLFYSTLGESDRTAVEEALAQAEQPWGA